VFIASLGFGMYAYFVPVFALSFGANYIDLGLIGSVWALATAITPMLAGPLSDRLNRAWIFSFSLTINALTAFTLIFSRSVLDLVILRLVGGIGMGFFWVTAEILVADLAPADKMVRDMGRYGIASAIGFLIGPVIGGLVIQGVGYPILFLISSAVIMISLAQSVVCVVPEYPKREFSHSLSSVSNLRIARGLLPWYMMLLCYGAVWGLISSIFPGYASSVGLSAAFIGFLFAAFGVARIFSNATVHRYLKYGEKRVLVFASLSIFTGVITLTVLPSFPTFLVGMMLIGGSFGVVFPIMISFVSRYFPNERMGAAVGSYETFVNSGGTVGPYLAGVLVSLTNIGSSFLIMSLFGLLMAFFVVKGGTYSSRC
jgi:MFS family permease